MNLKEIQKQFSLTIRNPEKKRSTENELIPGGSLNESSAIKVYSEAYIARLTESLGETYECCWWALGDDEFFTLCEKYIRQYSSTFYNLSDYGQEFSSFLEGYDDEMPYLAELARFEWKFKDFFHKKQEQGLSKLDLENVEKKRFKFVSSLETFYSPYRVASIFQARQEGKNDIDFNIEEPEWSVLYKKNNYVYIYDPGEAAYELLQRLISGLSIETAIENLSELSVEPASIQRLFHIFASEKLISGFITANTRE